MLDLRYQTPDGWLTAIRADFDAFLQDHAANERKASAAAIRLAVHHWDLPELVEAMIGLAAEEMEHFQRVYRILRERGVALGQDAPDPYMSKMHSLLRKESTMDFLLDRLLVFSLVEARGCERFGMLAEALEPGALKDFYADLTGAEARHRGLFLRVARDVFDPAAVARRLDGLIDAEAKIVAALPLRAALH